LPLEAGQYLWGDLVRKRVLAVPHALNPDAFQPRVAHDARQLDIGVRAVQYLPHLGDDERNRLHEFFLRHRFEPPLKVEVSSARLDRQGWAAYLNDTRGTVSTEAGRLVPGARRPYGGGDPPLDRRDFTARAAGHRPRLATSVMADWPWPAQGAPGRPKAQGPGVRPDAVQRR